MKKSLAGSSRSTSAGSVERTSTNKRTDGFLGSSRESFASSLNMSQAPSALHMQEDAEADLEQGCQAEEPEIEESIRSRVPYLQDAQQESLRGKTPLPYLQDDEDEQEHAAVKQEVREESLRSSVPLPYMQSEEEAEAAADSTSLRSTRPLPYLQEDADDDVQACAELSLSLPTSAGANEKDEAPAESLRSQRPLPYLEEPEGVGSLSTPRSLACPYLPQ